MRKSWMLCVIGPRDSGFSLASAITHCMFNHTMRQTIEERYGIESMRIYNILCEKVRRLVTACVDPFVSHCGTTLCSKLGAAASCEAS